MKIGIGVNDNFHTVAGKSSFNLKDDRIREYRKCWKEWPEKFQAGNFPLFIDIEVTSSCNLKCPFCATTFRGNKIKKGFISFDAVKKIIDEGSANNLYGVKFNVRGEPLLHHQIHKFIKYSKDKGLVDVYFNTNAVLLSGEVSRKLIDAGLDRVSISFEGNTKDIYESYRVGADYETVLSNIKNLQSLKKELGVQHPKIRIQTVMLPELESTFEEYKRFWTQFADEVAFLDYKEMKVKKKDIQYPWACSQIWQRMSIFWDGTILPCNHDDDALLNLGTIGQIKIKEAWKSRKLEEIREIHKNGMAHMIAACDGCYFRDSEIFKLTKKGDRK